MHSPAKFRNQPVTIAHAVLVLLLLAHASCSQPKPEGAFNKARMDSLFALIESQQKGMGSIAISKNGELAYQKSFGYADVKGNKAASPNTKYRIGSISKTFTAAIIMQLVDEGKLTLDTRLSEYFPAIPNSKDIAIEHLLRHRSGLYNFTNAKDYPEWMTAPKQKEELLEIMVRNGTVFAPNEKAEYSNTNYVLLSFIAEEIDRKAFSDILKQRITIPFNLSNTYYGGKITAEKDEAFSYNRIESWELAPETDMSIPAGAGAIISTPTDLNTFYHQLFSGKIVTEKSLNEMKKLVDNFGLGLFQIPFYDLRAFGHNGGIDGFRSNAGYFPGENVAIAYTSNGVVMPINDILIGALSIYFGKPYAFPEFKEPLRLKTEELDKYLGVYSSPTFPLKITITRKDNILIGQGTGQPSFPLEAYDIHKFKFDPAALRLEFIPLEKKMILLQGAGRFELSREN